MYNKIIPYFCLRPAVGRFQGFVRSIRRGLLHETWALPLDLFRIAAGGLCVAYFVTLFLQVQDFSAPDGFLDHTLLRDIFWFTRLSLFHPGFPASFFHVIFSIACLGSLGIVVGYRVKICAAILFIIAVSTYRRNFLVIYVDDAFMHLLLFWLLLLPVGHTLVLGEWLREGQSCLVRWRQIIVPGIVVKCFLANVCLLYLIAGLWKLTSPLWQQGFALYAILHLPIAYMPTFWEPQHLSLLQIANYWALVIEPLLPVFLLQRPRHPLKWFGLVCQLSFHLGILLTLRVPFANLGLMATACLFFRAEILQRLWPQTSSLAPGQRARLDSCGRIALVFLCVLSLAVSYRVPVLGMAYKPAYALLWTIGIAQDYHLFDWIDRTNYHVVYRVTTRSATGEVQRLDPAVIFPQSLRGTLVQAYIHNIRWMAVPSQRRRELRQSILTRTAQRFCRTYTPSAPVMVSAIIQRLRPENTTLNQSKERLVMEFQCHQQDAILCRTLLGQHHTSACMSGANDER